jgi:hypothetical protein
VLSQRSAQCDPCRSLPVDAAGWSVAIGRSTRGFKRGCGGQGRLLLACSFRRGPPRGRVCAVATLFLLLQPSHLFVGTLGRVAPCSMLPFLHAILRRLSEAHLPSFVALRYRPAGMCETLPPAMSLRGQRNVGVNRQGSRHRASNRPTQCTLRARHLLTLDLFSHLDKC